MPQFPFLAYPIVSRYLAMIESISASASSLTPQLPDPLKVGNHRSQMIAVLPVCHALVFFHARSSFLFDSDTPSPRGARIAFRLLDLQQPAAAKGCQRLILWRSAHRRELIRRRRGSRTSSKPCRSRPPASLCRRKVPSRKPLYACWIRPSPSRTARRPCGCGA